MTPPISSESLNQVLQTLPPERTDPFPHLTNLSPDGLLQRRVEIIGQLKTLERERQAIDAELLEVFSDAELRFGVRAPGGWVLPNDHEPVGTMTQKSVMPSRFSSSKHNGMGGHNHWRASICT